MTPGRFSLGMTVAILVLGGTAVSVEFGYLSAFRSYLVGEHGLRLSVMAAAAFLGVASGTYQLARVLALGEVGERVGLLERRCGAAGAATRSSGRRWPARKRANTASDRGGRACPVAGGERWR